MRYRGLIAGLSLLASLLGASGAGAISLTSEMEKTFALVEMSPPTAAGMTVCYGFRCRRRLELVFTAAERGLLTSTLAAGKASPTDERRAIQQAFVWFDRRVGLEVGTSRRVAYADVRALDDAHNFDCWDTTRNALGLLLVFQEWGALRHHTVSDPRYRGNFLFGQLPHNTAVIAERGSGAKWVVDMWTVAYGKAPDVMPLEKWLKEN